MSDSPDRHPLFSWLTFLIVLVIAIVLQNTVGPWKGEYVERIDIDACIAIILAVSLNIVNGYTGQFSIGHAAFSAIGGYAAATITYYGSLMLWNHTYAFASPGKFDGPFSQWMAELGASFMTQQSLFVVAMIVGGLVAALAGWVVGLPSLRLRGDYLAIVTLGFGEILRVLLQQTNAQLYTQEEVHAATAGQLFPPPVGGALGFTNIPKTTTLFWTSLLAGITLVIAWRLKKSTFGRSMIAIRENEIAAEAMGVNITRLKVWAFVFAAFFAGVAGALYAHEPGTQLGPSDGGFLRSFDIVIMVVLGGLGSISGATLAAVLLTLANEWLRDPAQPIPMFGMSVQVWMIAAVLLAVRLVVWPFDRTRAAIWGVGGIIALESIQFLARVYEIELGDYRMIIYALVLIGMMILRPGGLFGTAEITDLPRLRRQRLKLATPAGEPEVTQ
ncbi:hypothetical protein BH10PLA1_BH10PLA1_22720 [soil metagenome]